MSVPQPKLPHVALPNIRSIPTIPHVGSAGAHGTTYIGAQFGNLPDLHAAIAMKAVKKSLEEQIYALIQGELPFATRPPIYAVRAAQLTSEVADIAGTLAGVVAAVTGEANAAIAGINTKVAEMNSAKAALEGIPQGTRSAVQRLMITRYTRYVSELSAQVNRLNAAVASIGS